MAKTVEISDLDRSFMSEAIRLASESAASGGGPFGAVIVRDSRIVASGSNSVTRDTDPTAHAEVNAIPPHSPDAQRSPGVVPQGTSQEKIKKT